MPSPSGFATGGVFIRPQVSGSLVAANFLVLFLASFAIRLNEFPATLSWLLGVVLVVSVFENLLRHAFRVLPGSLVQVVLSDGQWTLLTRSGQWMQADLRQPVYIGFWFLVLRFSALTGSQTLVVTRDALAPDAFRRCYVSLKLDRSPPDA